MAIPHALPGQVIDVRPFGPAFAEARTAALFKVEGLEVLRLVIPRGKEIPTHSARGPITVHCLEGQVDFTLGGETHELHAGHLLYVPAGQPHSLRGIDDATVLVTIAISS
jgi:quercetin dioxygenase-like cupin family protein